MTFTQSEERSAASGRIGGTWEPKTHPSPFFFGWWVILICAFGLFLGPTPIVNYSFGVFVKPLTQEFHASRGAVSLAFTLSSTIVALGLPFAGRLIDRFGARRVVLPCMFGAGLIL